MMKSIYTEGRKRRTEWEGGGGRRRVTDKQSEDRVDVQLSSPQTPGPGDQSLEPPPRLDQVRFRTSLDSGHSLSLGEVLGQIWVRFITRPVLLLMNHRIYRTNDIIHQGLELDLGQRPGE